MKHLRGKSIYKPPLMIVHLYYHVNDAKPSAAPLAGVYRVKGKSKPQTMRVRPIYGAPDGLGGRDSLEVAHCLDASRPERFAG